MNIESKNRILDIAGKVLQSEAEAILHIKECLNGEFVAAVDLILACEGKVILTGIGKSGIIAKKVAATLASTGTPSFYLNPSE